MANEKYKKVGNEVFEALPIVNVDKKIAALQDDITRLDAQKVKVQAEIDLLTSLK